MYYNNSDRKLRDTYLENMEEINEKNEEMLVEAITKRILSVVPPLVDIVGDRLSALKDYKYDLTKDPDNFKMFVKSIKAEREKVQKAINTTEDLLRDMQKLQGLLESLTIKPKSVEEAKKDFDTIADIRELIGDILLTGADDTRGGVLASVINIIRSFDIFDTSNDTTGSMKKSEDSIENLELDF